MKQQFSKNKILEEIFLQKSLLHINIVRILETFEDHENFYIVMEYASTGDLYTRIQDGLQINEEIIQWLFKQLAEGVNHMHSRNIIHRDIKLNNILLDEGFTVKICDFGISKLIVNDELLTKQYGTPAYMSPEMI